MEVQFLSGAQKISLLDKIYLLCFIIKIMPAVSRREFLILSGVATGAALGGAAFPQSAGAEGEAGDQCDASIELELQLCCLDNQTRSGTGSLIVRNSGEQGETTVTLDSKLTRGTGTIEPSMATATLGPSGENTQPFTLPFTVAIQESREQLEDGAQLEWTVIDSSCRPEHNKDKRVNAEFPWCPPTEVGLTDFSARSKQDSSIRPPAIATGLAAIVARTAAVINYRDLRMSRIP